MTLKKIKGDLIELAEAGEFDVIVHGCNCFCVMGAGIAKQIATKYPGAWRADHCTESGDITKLGTWTAFETGHLTIINAYTQFGVRTKEQPDVFEYGAFALILRKLAYVYPGAKFGLPYIGMGLAGGNPDRIMAIIENFARKNDVSLVEYNG
jgi:O-acetyl-ADP-ribose deacetylase (regulator of RNase III)